MSRCRFNETLPDTRVDLGFPAATLPTINTHETVEHESEIEHDRFVPSSKGQIGKDGKKGLLFFRLYEGRDFSCARV